ncbi:MAG: hypothetical protein ABIH23_15480 [bacterium]
MTKKLQVFFAPRIVRSWPSIKVCNQPLPKEPIPGCVGYIPIFTEKALAEEWAAGNGCMAFDELPEIKEANDD